MKDNLEKFILENRQAFDSDAPSPKIWNRIDQQIHPRPVNHRLSMWRTLGIAASVVLLVGFGALIGANFLSPHSSYQNNLATVPDTELEEMETYFQEQIEQKKARLASMQYNGNVNEDLQQLDGFLEELKKELKVSPAGAEQQIIDAMINNYRIRIDILERILTSLESTNPQINKTEEDEKTSI